MLLAGSTHALLLACGCMNVNVGAIPVLRLLYKAKKGRHIEKVLGEKRVLEEMTAAQTYDTSCHGSGVKSALNF